MAKTWKQAWCPSVSEWLLNKLVHLDTGILFSAKKKWAIKPWKDGENSNACY